MYECIFEWVFICIYPTPPQRTGCNTRSVFKRSTTGLNSNFSSSLIDCLNKAKEPNLRSYLLIAGKRIDRIIPFLGVLSQNETPTASSRIWTQIANYISSNDNRRYSIHFYISLRLWVHVRKYPHEYVHVHENVCVCVCVCVSMCVCPCSCARVNFLW